MYAGTGSVLRREALNGRKFTSDFRPRFEEKPGTFSIITNRLKEKREKRNKRTLMHYIAMAIYYSVGLITI